MGKYVHRDGEMTTVRIANAQPFFDNPLGAMDPLIKPSRVCHGVTVHVIAKRDTTLELPQSSLPQGVYERDVERR
jgi:hypothetical protein